MKKVCIVTSTRAEYGLLRGVIKRLSAFDDLSTDVVVTGAHLVESQGYTVREIKDDGLAIAAEIPIMDEVKDGFDMSSVAARALKGFAAFLHEEPQDTVVILGDRYEMMGFAYAAVLANIPVVHLHGGEITEGAVDDIVRHCLTKMSSLHFASTEEYRKRIIQMGENPQNVYNSGAPGVENVKSVDLMSEAEIRKALGELKGADSLEGQFALVTFHPVTTEVGEAKVQVRELLSAMDAFPEIFFVITKANADAGGQVINKVFEDYVSDHDNTLLVASLGMRRYLSAMKYAAFVLGNSSSGIIETPSFHIPTVNVGDRQAGRVRADSVIDCETVADVIKAAMEKALDSGFKDSLADAANPYEKAGTAEFIAFTIHDYLINDKLSVRKRFYDI